MRPVFLLLKQSLSLHHMNIWKQWNVTYIIIIWWFTPCLVLPILYIYRYFWQKIGDYWWIIQYRAKGMNKAFSVLCTVYIENQEKDNDPRKKDWKSWYIENQKKRMTPKSGYLENQTDRLSGFCFSSPHFPPPLFLLLTWPLTNMYFLFVKWICWTCMCLLTQMDFLFIFFSHKNGCFYGPGGWGKILCVLSKVGK